jgi:hypothetical protein
MFVNMKPLFYNGKRKLTPNVTPNTLESMIEYTLISSILGRICEMTKIVGISKR